jgi:sulfite oxidase
VTKFVANHPGGKDKIMLAAGDSVDPFWRVYKQHSNSNLPMEILLPLRVGTLHPDDVSDLAAKVDTSDPYSSDPPTSPLLSKLSDKPVNAECPAALLTDSWITPEELWFVRNHHPVPLVAEEDCRVSVSGLGVGSGRTLSLSDLKSGFQKHEVVASLQCGGNRRREMTEVSRTLGSPWELAAISNARWGGVKLSDVITELVGRDPAVLRGYSEHDWHVQFKSVDGVAASIPLEKALNPREWRGVTRSLHAD